MTPEMLKDVIYSSHPGSWKDDIQVVVLVNSIIQELLKRCNIELKEAEEGG